MSLCSVVFGSLPVSIICIVPLRDEDLHESRAPSARRNEGCDLGRYAEPARPPVFDRRILIDRYGPRDQPEYRTVRKLAGGPSLWREGEYGFPPDTTGRLSLVKVAVAQAKSCGFVV